jgi:hypothetical protein
VIFVLNIEKYCRGGPSEVQLVHPGCPNHLFPLKILTLKDLTVKLLKWLRNCWRFSSIILIEFNLKRLSMSILIEGSTILNTKIIYIKIRPQMAIILRMKQSLKMKEPKRCQHHCRKRWKMSQFKNISNHCRLRDDALKLFQDFLQCFYFLLRYSLSSVSH